MSLSLMFKILLLNGPNLNFLGIREPEKYGTQTLLEIETILKNQARQYPIELACYQSNHEGALIDRIQQAYRDQVDFIVFNPAAYTHTSIALRDALLAVQIPFIEIHITDPKKRESYRKNSYFEDISIKTIAGEGILGYQLALQDAISYLHPKCIKIT